MWTYMTVLISVLLALSYEIIGYGASHRVVCLFTPQLLLVLFAPTHEGMARLS